ncbi:MAG TPA: helix-turn-helix transcriptional regulator [Bryobacteraceae bacterium]|nr:helix-turn-helix transcriptional regulator [Bryobacteraceae bacterium]
MDPASRADNRRRVRDELQRMALDELRNAKQLTQADLAEMLDVPQSSISRIEQRADMYLSTLRNYVRALGGALEIQAVFPDGRKVAISRFWEYEDQAYIVQARAQGGGRYRLDARPVSRGVPLSTKALKIQALIKTLRALQLTDPQISAIRKNLEEGSVTETEIGGRMAQREFSAPDLVAAGFEAMSTGAANDK